MKIALAFVAGIALALGGALIYVKSSDRAPVQPVAKTAAQTPAAPAALPDAGLNTPPPSSSSPAPEASSAAPEPPAHSKTSRSDLRALGHKYSHNGEQRNGETTAPQLLAQNGAPAPSNSPADSYAPPPVPDNAPPSRPAVQEPTSQPQAVAPPPTPRSVTLDAGTSIVVRLLQTVSTKDANSGDTFRATLQMPIVRDGAVIAERGATVVGRVVSAERAGKVKGRSDLQLALSEISTTDGQHVPVQTSVVDHQGQSGTKGDAAKVGGGAALGAIIGAIAGGGKGAGIGAGVGGAAGAGDVLLTRGKDVVLQNETELTFRLSQPVTITEQLH